MNLTITSYSTARISTWHYIKELNLLFDCGDGVVSNLYSIIPGIKHIFLSHGDRDHISSLMRVCELIPKDNDVKIYYPKDCIHINKLKRFIIDFSKKPKESSWIPISNGDEIFLNKNTFVKCITNNHIKGNKNLSFSFKVYNRKTKLKTSLIGLPQTDLLKLKTKYGSEYITNVVNTGLLGYSGDCKFNPKHWDDIPKIIHECTFLFKKDVDNTHHKHTYLEDIAPFINNNTNKQFILSHISSRYNNNILDRYLKSKGVNIIYPSKICNFNI